MTLHKRGVPEISPLKTAHHGLRRKATGERNATEKGRRVQSENVDWRFKKGGKAGRAAVYSLVGTGQSCHRKESCRGPRGREALWASREKHSPGVE